MDYFWAGIRGKKIFRGLLIHTNNFCFLNIALFLLYLQFTIFFYGRTDKGTLTHIPEQENITQVRSFLILFF